MGEAVELFLVAVLAFLTSHFILALIDIWKARRLERRAAAEDRRLPLGQTIVPWPGIEEARRASERREEARRASEAREPVCTCPDWPAETDDECPEHNQAWRR